MKNREVVVKLSEMETFKSLLSIFDEICSDKKITVERRLFYHAKLKVAVNAVGKEQVISKEELTE